jgi:hypothetical protein
MGSANEAPEWLQALRRRENLLRAVVFEDAGSDERAEDSRQSARVRAPAEDL